MRPSVSCPFKRSWLRQEHEEDLPAPVQGTLVAFPDDHRYQECRRVRATRATVNILNPRPAGVFENAELDPNELFLGEDGRMKKFVEFKEGDSLFHVHGGVREQTASANVFKGGFTCFGCSKTYRLPSPDGGLDAYYADDFAFLESETQRSDEPTAYMPDVDWTTHLKRKFVVISAPMGAGKTEQVARLLLSDSCPPRVLVISFRVMLAVQQANRFSLDCYVDLDDAAVSNVVACCDSA
jgi:hypothetical protein